MKPILYATPLCPDCKPMREYLDSKNFQYDYIDITSDIFLLKEFIKHRDTREEFNEIREKSYLGVPTLLLNDKFYFDEDIKNAIK